MDCNSLECIYGDFHSLVFPGTDLEKRQGDGDWLWYYDDYVYTGFGTNVEVIVMVFLKIAVTLWQMLFAILVFIVAVELVQNGETRKLLMAAGMAAMCFLTMLVIWR